MAGPYGDCQAGRSARRAAFPFLSTVFSWRSDVVWRFARSASARNMAFILASVDATSARTAAMVSARSAPGFRVGELHSDSCIVRFLLSGLVS
ncbi:hypothetical protein HY68_01480 [Streptomyces sp. AcH 505]|nr:hypothetical protein HY68_01480 [Streptomyces sp. AcH 505]